MHWAARRIAPILLVVACGVTVAAAQGPPALVEAETLLRSGRPGEAAAAIERSGLAATDAQASYLLGFALIQVYRSVDAEVALERAVAMRPDQHPWWHALAKARLEQGRNLAALEALERAIALSDQPSYRYARAMCALNVGELGLARRELEATVAAAPEHADAHYQLGRLALDEGSHEAALPPLRRALEVNPDHLEARYRLGLAELGAGRPEAAAAELGRVVGQVPGHAGALYNLGRALVLAGREEEGRRRLRDFEATSGLRDEIDFLRRAVKRNPDNLEGRALLAAKYLENGQAAEALQELAAARDLDPGRSATYRALGATLRFLGRAEEARQAEEFGRRLAGGSG